MTSNDRAKPAKILVCEDESLVISSMKLLLKGHDLRFFKCLPEFLASNETSDFDLLLLDLCHDGDPHGKETIRLFPEAQRRLPNTEIVIQSGLKDISIMRKCLELGAEKFVLKDHIADEIPVFVEHCLERRRLRLDLDQKLVGESKAMMDLKKRILELRKQNNSVDVLIEGETGCGKELCAKALHREGPFIGINVAAIPDELFEAELFGAEKGAYTGASGSRAGYLESAESGVLFMDEIQSLPLPLQAKLLRVIETRSFYRVGSTTEKKFLGRFVSASNQPLLDFVEKGLFREDLYYRLASSKLSVPPLRARPGDISLLAQTLLRDSGAKNLQFTEKALEFLECAYDWPGNVRELKTLVRSLAMDAKMPFLDVPEIKSYLEESESAVESGLLKTKEKLSAHGQFKAEIQLGFDENISRLEKHLLEETLREHNSSQAREILKLSRTRFYEKLKQHGLQVRSKTEDSGA